MKRILITGANSYIGTSVETYLKRWEDRYAVDTVDMVDGSWREKSFRGYDAVFHVAGIVHQEKKKKLIFVTKLLIRSTPFLLYQYLIK